MSTKQEVMDTLVWYIATDKSLLAKFDAHYRERLRFLNYQPPLYWAAREHWTVRTWLELLTSDEFSTDARVRHRKPRGNE